jgi:type IX secretion system PorP/SprF family membrane protein
MKEIKLYTIAFSIFLAAASISNVKAQQNIQFTQYMFNSLSVNPAYAGYKEQWFLQTTVRTQWVGIEGAPQTNQISIDGVTNNENKRYGIGLQITTDKLGPQTTNSVYGNYAYRIQLDAEDTKRLSFGIGVGITQYGLNGSLLHPTDAGDPAITKNSLDSYIPDFRFGVYYSSPKWYLGFSIMDMLSTNFGGKLFHWDTSDTANIIRKPHFYVIAGSLFDITESIKVRPGILFKEDLQGPTSLDLNTMFIYNNKFWVGASYRTAVELWRKKFDNGGGLTRRNSVSGIVQVNVTDNFRVGYSYDYVINGLDQVQHGSHEITIGWTIPSTSQRLLSPRFF